MYTGDSESVSVYTQPSSGLAFGVTVGIMSLIIVCIITAYVTTTVILIRIKTSLQANLKNLKEKGKEPHAIYEELEYQSIKSSLPTIDTGENAAYSPAAPKSTIIKDI